MFSVNGIGRALRAGALALALLSAAAAAQDVTIVTLAQGSLGAATGVALARLFDENGIKARAVPTGGPDVMLPLLQAGEADFAIMSADAAGLAAGGMSIFKGQDYSRIRFVSHLLPYEVGFFVRADSDIKSFADLRGKRLPSGFTQQQILGLWAQAHLAAAGIGEKDYSPVPTASGLNAIEDFTAGRVDAAFNTVGIGPVAQASVAVGGIRMLALPERPDLDAFLTGIVPGTWTRVVEPSATNVGVVAPTRLMGSTIVLLANEGVDPALVGKVTGILHEGADELRAILPAFAKFDPAAMNRPVANIAFHDGAAAYYTGKGM